jgi:predicted lipoprotein with Yx(FWY)xxD motif
MKTRNLLIGSAIVLLGVVLGCSSDRNVEGYSTQSGGADYMENQSYMTDSSVGSVMTTPQGMTVYTYDKDQPGVSNCYGECASHWPPVTASANALPYGNMTIINRTDGRRQWAYNGMPLYTYVDDTNMGEVAGDNEGGVWHVVQ